MANEYHGTSSRRLCNMAAFVTNLASRGHLNSGYLLFSSNRLGYSADAEQTISSHKLHHDVNDWGRTEATKLVLQPAGARARLPDGMEIL